MRSELHHIESDFEALTWSIGCVLASYVERSRAMTLIDTDLGRALLALLILSQVLSMTFATALTAAWRLEDTGLLNSLGALLPGDDYHRFIPLMEATQWWLHALWISAAALFAVSAVQLLRGSRTAFPLFAAGWIFGVAGNRISEKLPAFRQAFSFPEPMFTRDVLIPTATTLLPVLIAIALWVHGWCSTECRSQSDGADGISASRGSE